MKRNAIVRLIIYSLLVLALTGVLVTGLLSNFVIDISGTDGIVVNYEANVEAESCIDLEINWAAGNVTVKREDVDRIYFRETSDSEIKRPMTYRYTGGTLELNHSSTSFSWGIRNPQEKNLVVVVPMDWKCGKLTVNGAALDITLRDLKVEELKVNGADMNVSFFGWTKSVEIDGAGCVAVLTCTNSVQSIEMDGAGCELTVTLPEESGFTVQMEGLGCSYSSDIASYRENGNIVYGDQECKIEVDGVGCHVGVYFGGLTPTVFYPLDCGDEFTESLLLEPPESAYAPGTIVTLKTEILTDVDLELYVNGQFICTQTECRAPDGSNHWEFSFTMPNESVTIRLKTANGIES